MAHVLHIITKNLSLNLNRNSIITLALMGIIVMSCEPGNTRRELPTTEVISVVDPGSSMSEVRKFLFWSTKMMEVDTITIWTNRKGELQPGDTLIFSVSYVTFGSYVVSDMNLEYISLEPCSVSMLMISWRPPMTNYRMRIEQEWILFYEDDEKKLKNQEPDIVLKIVPE